MGGFSCSASRKWQVLRVGCEARTLDDWIDNAEGIDKRRGAPGLHHQTRALAQYLRDKTDE